MTTTPYKWYSYLILLRLDHAILHPALEDLFIADDHRQISEVFPAFVESQVDNYCVVHTLSIVVLGGIWACLRLAQPGAPANVQLFGCIGAVCSIAAITTGVVYRSSLKSYPGRSARDKVCEEGFTISLARPTTDPGRAPSLGVLGSYLFVGYVRRVVVELSRQHIRM
ncbi:hypothetical protein NLI96_g7607 [Meripilus lineatus]|uniref:Uncharacterized protein n=1 Tax=Meripilus lineatus TaxID=2056292 RepID=A0AAD5V115_9APHY|nr:hypothetical protein NLI96_g7607 [Physisporinus lineatus]